MSVKFYHHWHLDWNDVTGRWSKKLLTLQHVYVMLKHMLNKHALVDLFSADISQHEREGQM